VAPVRTQEALEDSDRGREVGVVLLDEAFGDSRVAPQLIKVDPEDRRRVALDLWDCGKR
jgi:hypothetical protein